MGKDLLDDQYGRFYEIPKILAKKGHTITGLCLSYRKRKEYLFNDQANASEAPSWFSVNLGIMKVLGLFRYMTQLDRIIEATRPDIICGCSDSMHAILAAHFSRRHKTKLLIDLYDNFHSYGATSLPGIRAGFVRSLKEADGICTVSDRLRRYMLDRHSLSQPFIVLGNAINRDLFNPGDQSSSRCLLGLPNNGLLVGTAGALHKNRDIQSLYAAFEALRKRNCDIHLVIAGPRNRRVKIPVGDQIHDLGILRHSDVATLYRALDVGVICNLDSEFGRYCYPQKFFEMLACNIPIISSSVGTMKDMLGSDSYALYQPGDPESLATGIEGLLSHPRIPDLPIPDWEDRAGELESFIRQIIQDGD
jgi:glycosyltransferase involved in cell wall biosynthesis